MTRSCYVDDYGDEYPGQLELYRANVARSMRGRAGQARLRELRDALLALPIKELHAVTFVDGTPENPKVCALGAWALHQKGFDAARSLVQRDGDDAETFAALAPAGWPKLVVYDAIFENDDDRFRYISVEGPHQSPYAYFRHGPVMYRVDETPADRYARLLAWVEAHIVMDGQR